MPSARSCNHPLPVPSLAARRSGADFVRDTAATAAIFAFFASGWFGWAQDQPPPTWRKALIAGSMASALIALAGGVLTWWHWSDATVFDADTSRAFGVVVGIEFAVAALGAAVLTVRRRSDIIAPWIAFVVGVHLFPLAVLLHDPAIYVVAVLVTLSALGAVPLAASRRLPVSAVTGLAAGSILLAAAFVSIGSAFRGL
jgi:hypothetical protein